jgi:hypothetical protein
MATYLLAPSPCNTTFFIPGTNQPGNGVQVFTYTANTNTKVSVAKDAAGAALHTNPIVLDSGGNLPSGSSMYILSGQTIDVVYAPANDTDPPASPYRTVQDVIGVPAATVSSQVEWVTLSTPTYLAAASFRVDGDQTATLTVGRRVRTTGSSTVYSRITSSALASASTTIGVVNDFATSLDTSLTSGAYGMLSATSHAVPLLTDHFPLVRSSSAVHTFSVNISSYSANRTFTLPNYDFSILDEDTMASDSATDLATQQSIKAYVDGVSTASFVTGGGSKWPFVTTATFNFVSNITEGSWESVGPTGSGATNIWTALDQVPTDVDWIEVKLDVTGITSGGTAEATMSFVVYAIGHGGTKTATWQTSIARTDDRSTAAGNASAGTLAIAKIPVGDSSSTLVFDMTYVSTFESTDVGNMALTGFGYNNSGGP